MPSVHLADSKTKDQRAMSSSMPWYALPAWRLMHLTSAMCGVMQYHARHRAERQDADHRTVAFP